MANQGSSSQTNPAAGGYGQEDLHAELWMSCAGPLVDVPRTRERVFYFPQGHLEQLEASTNREVNTNFHLPSKILCRVLDIKLRAEHDTDEVYAEITLLPEQHQNEPTTPDPYRREPPRPTVYSFYKVLTPCDTRTHGALSVPRERGTACLPPLDMNQPTPTQELIATDLQGLEWRFKHIFRGRHLLTKGWSTFVSSKRLVAGDTFVFLRGDSGELRVGVRRATRRQSSMPSSVISGDGVRFGALATAAFAVTTGGYFVVCYKPRTSQFIIGLNKYLEAVNNGFAVGTRFKMAFEGEDSPKRRFKGTIVGSEDLSPLWEKSKWRSLRVQWDEPASIARPDRVSPWEIEPLVPSMSSSQVQPIIGKNKRPQPPSEIPDREMRRFERITQGRLVESSQETRETPRGMQLQATHALFSEEIEEGEISLAQRSKIARTDREQTSAAGAIAEPISDDFFDLPPLNLLPSPQASGGYVEVGDSLEPPSPLTPRTQSSLEAARAAEEEAEAQAQLERYNDQHRAVCNLPAPQPTECPSCREPNFTGITIEKLTAAEQCLVEGIQRQVMATANARVDLAKAEADRDKFVQDGLRLKQRQRDLEHRVRELEEYRDRTQNLEQDVKRIRGERNFLRDEVEQVKRELRRLQGIEVALRATNASVIEEHNRALKERNDLQVQLREAKRKVEERAHQLEEVDTDVVRVAAVNYTVETVRGGTLDWREFGDPDLNAPEDYLDTGGLVLPNPTSSWIPYVPEPNLDSLAPADFAAPQGTEAIDTLAGIDFTTLGFMERVLTYPTEGDFSGAPI